MTVDSVSKMIASSPTKSCQLDAIPTWLLKEEAVLDALLPSITHIVNNSLSTGTVPSTMKRAVITPILKKKGLDTDDFKNYRPISNLPFLGKLTEKVVADQLTAHMKANNLHDINQSAYKKCHSTETALVKIKHDINLAMDQDSGVLLILLDLSAAFDTIDHSTLIERLRCLGINGQVLQWFTSYLQNRTQRVTVSGFQSVPVPLNIGVPQGSVLGPMLFLTYVLPLKDIFEKHNIKYHAYADDTQVYVPFSLKDPSELRNAVKRMENCLTEVRDWMTMNKLCLNDNKTELIIFTSRYHQNAIQGLYEQVKIKIGDSYIEPKQTVKNLGVTFDSELKMSAQVSNVARNMYINIRSLGRIRRYLDQPTCASVAASLAMSRLDYGNVLLKGALVQDIKRLQLAQNTLARLVTGSPRQAHITPILQALHWLPVHLRIDFKVLSLVYKTLNNDDAPVYLQHLLQPQTHARELRSASDKTLLAPVRSYKAVGDRAFGVYAPNLWKET